MERKKIDNSYVTDFNRKISHLVQLHESRRTYNFTEILEKLYSSGWLGKQCFNTRNVVNDEVYLLYDKDGVKIYICEYWDYYEVIGLDNIDFFVLKNGFKWLNFSLDLKR